MPRHTRARALPALCALAAAVLAAPALRAQTIATETGTVHATAALSSAATYGASMSGMRVTAHFVDGASLTTAWGDLGDGRFGASTARFRLAFPGAENTGSPGSYLWTLENLWSGGLTRLVLAGAPGGTVFDMDGEAELTLDSALGIPLAFGPAGEEGDASPYAAGATATYRNAVALVGATPLGDLFEQVDLVFGLALAAGDGVAFDLDTDSIGDGASLDPIAPPVTTTPEPAGVALLGGGLAALGAARARRRPTRG
jgi:hypothetical protein